MAHKIRVGLFRKTTRYKPLWCNHADWLLLKALSVRLDRTMLELLHEVLVVYKECTGQKHIKEIESLNNKVIILADLVRKYRDRFGIIKD